MLTFRQRNVYDDPVTFSEIDRLSSEQGTHDRNKVHLYRQMYKCSLLKNTSTPFSLSRRTVEGYQCFEQRLTDLVTIRSIFPASALPPSVESTFLVFTALIPSSVDSNKLPIWALWCIWYSSHLSFIGGQLFLLSVETLARLPFFFFIAVKIFANSFSACNRQLTSSYLWMIWSYLIKVLHTHVALSSPGFWCNISDPCAN